MAYSQQRLLRTLALVRMATGLVFLVLGQYKISSITYARGEFLQFLDTAQYGGAVHFYRTSVLPTLWNHPGFFATLTGFTELTIGVGLLLGLAVRPVCLLGVVYMAHLMLATWSLPVPGALLWQHLSIQVPHIFPIFLFLLLGVGHAGEIWGLGSLYHRKPQFEEGEQREEGPERQRPAFAGEPSPPPKPEEWEEERTEFEGLESERAES